MRKELELIEKIENYLLGKMDPKAKAEFEKEIQNNPDLAQKVNAQSKIVDALQNMVLKGKVKKGRTQYKLKKIGLKVLIGIGIAGAITTGIFVMNNQDEKSNNQEIQKSNYQNVLKEADGGEFETELDNQIFIINNSQDTVVETEDGMVIYIPANTFDVEGNYELLVKEAIQADDIMKAGLQTFDQEGNLLETGGMFRIEGIKNNQILSMNKGKEFTVNVPTNNKKGGMSLYDGVRNKKGNIEWANPKEIENILTPVDILTLDFYPPNYEDSLNAWGKSTDKKYRDSLYYSFAGFCDQGNGADQFVSNNLDLDLGLNDSMMSAAKVQRTPMQGWKNRPFMEYEANPNYNITYTLYTDYTFEINVGVREGDRTKNRIINVQTQGGAEIMMDMNTATKNPPYYVNQYTFSVANVERIKIYGYYPMGTIMNNPSADLNSVPEQQLTEIVIPQVEIGMADTAMVADTYCNVLDPSKVKAIWNRKFNKTNLATKEFEERMKYIHTSCSPNIIDAYVNGLEKNLWECDSIAYAVSGNSKFEEFKNRKDGKVKLNSKAQQKFQAYFEKKSSAYQEEAKEIRANYYKKHQELREQFRSAQNKNEQENVTQLYQQMEQETQYMLRNIKPTPPQSYTVSVPSPGWKNIDQKVREKVWARESGTVTDGFNTVTLSFSSQTFTINNREQFDRIKFYMLPQEINSYIRVNEKEGKWTYKTNDDMKYDLVVIAYDDQGNIFSYQEKVVREGKNISMKKDNIKNLKRSLNNTDIKNEVDFIHSDLANLKRERKFIDDALFRGKVQNVIFANCLAGEDGGPNLFGAEEIKDEELW